MGEMDGFIMLQYHYIVVPAFMFRIQILCLKRLRYNMISQFVWRALKILVYYNKYNMSTVFLFIYLLIFYSLHGS